MMTKRISPLKGKPQKLGGCEVKPLPAAIELPATILADINGSTQCDPFNCWLSRSGLRIRGVQSVCTVNSMYYIKYVNEPNVWYKGQLSADAMRKKKEFDQNWEAVRACARAFVGTVIVINPPSPTNMPGSRIGFSGTDKRRSKTDRLPRTPSTRPRPSQQLLNEAGVGQ
jgi:hypothetical protein